MRHTPQCKKIVIAGGGFAGIQAALFLDKKLGDYEILVINKRPLHVYRPDLYEIATAYNEKITKECLVRLKDTVAFPLATVFRNTKIRAVSDIVIKINPHEKTVITQKNGPLSWDYLVLALGSVTNYYNITGLKENSLHLKSIRDALAISCDLDQLFYKKWAEQKTIALHKQVRIIVGGGGATGIELACELAGYTKNLCRKYSFDHRNVHIEIIEALDEAGGQGAKASAVIVKRLAQLGVKTHLKTRISNVDKQYLQATTSKGHEKITFDLFIWTGGVKAHPIIAETFKNVSRTGGILVNKYLQVPDYPHIYAAGDCATVLDTGTKKPLPMLAQLAMQQGKHAGKMILADVHGAQKWPYTAHYKGTITPLGGTYALYKRKNLMFSGFFPWLLRRFIDLVYSMKLLPPWYAFKKWIRDTTIFISNK